MSHRPRIELSAKRIHLDGDVGIRLVGVEPGSEVTRFLRNEEMR